MDNLKIAKEEKAQVSLEFLVLLGGIIFVTAIIGLYLKSIANQVSAEGEKILED